MQKNVITATRVIIYLFIIVCFKFVVIRTISDFCWQKYCEKMRYQTIFPYSEGESP